MRKILFIIAAVILVLITCTARSRQRVSDVFVIRDKVTHRMPVVDAGQRRLRDDTIYTTDIYIVRRWNVPADTVSAAMHARKNIVVRLSGRNIHGRYTHLETMSLGEPQTGLFSVMATNFGGEYTGTQLAGIIGKTSAIDLIARPDSPQVYEERYYAPDGSMTGFSTVKYLADNMAVEYMFDSFGRPVSLLDSSGGQLVGVVSVPDSSGRDSLVYFQAGGRPFELPYGYAGIRTCRSADGKSDTIYYINAALADVTVQGGVCFYIDTDTVIDGLKAQRRSYYGSDRKPVRVGEGYHDPNAFCGAAVMVVFTDSLGDVTRMRLYDTDGSPCDAASGIHEIRKSYSSDSRLLTSEGRSLSGRLVPYLGDGIYREVNGYDKSGRLISTVYQDSAGRPAAIDGQPTIFNYGYNAAGELDSTVYKTVSQSVEQIYYMQVIAPGRTYTRYEDGSESVTLYDDKGRETSYRIVDAGGNLDSTVSFPLREYGYSCGKRGGTVRTARMYDSMGQLRRTEVEDSSAYTSLVHEYDTTGILSDRYRIEYSPGFEDFMAQVNVNRFGHPARISGSNIYNRMCGRQTFDGKFYHTYAVDEFGEPDYICGADGYAFSSSRTLRDNTYFYDEDGVQILDFKDCRNRLPKLMSIEVIDTAAYALGIRDNDIILGLGDYVPSPYYSWQDFIADWGVSEVLGADSARVLSVFRIESTEPPCCSVKEIQLPAGPVDELGFFAAPTFKTRLQMERIKRAARDAGLERCIGRFDKTRPADGADVVVAFPSPFLKDRDSELSRQSMAPVIVLGAKAGITEGLYWTIRQPMEEVNRHFYLAYPYIESIPSTLTYTKNGRTTAEYEFKDYTCGLFSGRVDSAVWRRLESVAPVYTGSMPLPAAEDNKDVWFNFARKLYYSEFRRESFCIDSILFSTGYRPSLKNLVMDYFSGAGTAKSDSMAVALAIHGLENNEPRGAMSLASMYYAVDDTANMDIVLKHLDMAHVAPLQSLALAIASQKAAADSLEAAEYLADCVLRYPCSRTSDMQDIQEMIDTLKTYGHEYEKQYGKSLIYSVISAGRHFCNPSECAQTLATGFKLYGEYDFHNDTINTAFYLGIGSIADADSSAGEILRRFMADKLLAIIILDNSPARKSGLKGSYYLLDYNDWSVASPASWAVERDKLPEKITASFMNIRNNKIKTLDFGPLIGGLVLLRTVGTDERNRVIERYNKWKAGR